MADATAKLRRLGLALGALGVLAWLARWLIQGEHAPWTDLARRFWVADPALGWVETSERWIWLGLEGLLATAGILGATLTLSLLARRATGRWRRVLAVTLALGTGVSALAPLLPIAAFVSGLPPDGAERLLPLAANVAPAPPTDRGAQPALPALPVPAGRWRVVDDPATSLLAVRAAAGSDTFDITFGPLTGTVTFDPAAPAATRATLSVPAASLATGLALRDGHARKFLAAAEHPTITLALGSLDAPLGPGATANDRRWHGQVVLTLMGADLALEAQGAIALRPDGTLLVQGGFELPLARTRLDPKDFDQDRLFVTTRFVLAPAR